MMEYVKLQLGSFEHEKQDIEEWDADGKPVLSSSELLGFVGYYTSVLPNPLTNIDLPQDLIRTTFSIADHENGGLDIRNEGHVMLIDTRTGRGVASIPGWGVGHCLTNIFTKREKSKLTKSELREIALKKKEKKARQKEKRKEGKSNIKNNQKKLNTAQHEEMLDDTQRSCTTTTFHTCYEHCDDHCAPESLPEHSTPQALLETERPTGISAITAALRAEYQDMSGSTTLNPGADEWFPTQEPQGSQSHEEKETDAQVVAIKGDEWDQQRAQRAAAEEARPFETVGPKKKRGKTGGSGKKYGKK